MRLRGKVFRGDVLWRAWISVQRNRGAPGIDQITLGHVEGYGVTRLLGELAAELGEGRYRGVADASGVHCEARHERAASVVDSRSSGPYRAGRVEDRARAGLRGRLSAV